MNRTARTVLQVVVGLALVLTSTVPVAAEPISTSAALELERSGEAHATVDAYLARAEVARELAALGVDPELARLRAAALSPSELEGLAGRIADAPAGGNVIGVLGVTFLVLLILELVGVIDIFKRI